MRRLLVNTERTKTKFKLAGYGKSFEKSETWLPITSISSSTNGSISLIERGHHSPKETFSQRTKTSLTYCPPIVSLKKLSLATNIVTQMVFGVKSFLLTFFAITIPNVVCSSFFFNLHNLHFSETKAQYGPHFLALIFSCNCLPVQLWFHYIFFFYEN